MKRMYFIPLMLVCLLMPAAIAFGSGGTEAEDTNGGIELSPPGVFPIVDETYTMTALAVPNASVEDMETNYSTLWWEEQTNVHIEWELVIGSDAGQKINLVLSAGDDLPDVIVNSDLNMEQQFLYGSQGIIAPLNDLVAEHAPNINKLWTETDPYVAQQLTAPDGNIYSMSIRPFAYHSTLSQKMWINSVWLDNLGLDMPTTPAEFRDVLIAFRDQDANGNGDPNDEVPYSGAADAWRGTMGAFFMNAFIYDDGFHDIVNANRLVIEDGRIFPAYTQPEWRDGLRYLNQLHDEGLLDPEGFVQDQNSLRALNNGGSDLPAKVGSVQSGHQRYFSAHLSPVYLQYEAVTPLVGPDGLQTTGFFPKNQRGSRFLITTEADNPAIAIRWADLGFTDTGRMVSTFGEEGKHWRWAEPGEISFTGEQAVWVPLEPVSGAQNVRWSHFMPNYFPGDSFDAKYYDDFDPNDIEVVLYRETAEKYEGHQPDEVVPPLNMEIEVGAEFGQLRTSINEYVKQTYARFVTGDLDVERDWDSYLAEFDRLQLDRYMEIVQETYDRQYGN